MAKGFYNNTGFLNDKEIELVAAVVGLALRDYCDPRALKEEKRRVKKWRRMTKNVPLPPSNRQTAIAFFTKSNLFKYSQLNFDYIVRHECELNKWPLPFDFELVKERVDDANK